MDEKCVQKRKIYWKVIQVKLSTMRSVNFIWSHKTLSLYSQWNNIDWTMTNYLLSHDLANIYALSMICGPVVFSGGLLRFHGTLVLRVFRVVNFLYIAYMESSWIQMHLILQKFCYTIVWLIINLRYDTHLKNSGPFILKFSFQRKPLL